MAVKKIYTDIEIIGTGSFTGVITGVAGIVDADLVTKGQVEAYNYMQALQDDGVPVLAASLDANGFSINNLQNIVGTGSITIDGAISASNISGTNTGDQDLSLFLPLAAGNLAPLTGAIFGGEDVIVADTAKHIVLWDNILKLAVSGGTTLHRTTSLISDVLKPFCGSRLRNKAAYSSTMRSILVAICQVTMSLSS